MHALSVHRVDGFGKENFLPSVAWFPTFPPKIKSGSRFASALCLLPESVDRFQANSSSASSRRSPDARAAMADRKFRTCAAPAIEDLWFRTQEARC